jgi:hypothetical protein
VIYISSGRITVRKRDQLSQELHDWVIEMAVERLYGKFREAGRKIYTNPNQQKNFEVSGFYPDIVVYNPETKKVTFIDEIETEVGDVEKNQWEDFAKLGIAFSLTVQLRDVENAKKIIKDNKIGVTSLWSYKTDYPTTKTIEFKEETLS